MAASRVLLFQELRIRPRTTGKGAKQTPLNPNSAPAAKINAVIERQFSSKPATTVERDAKLLFPICQDRLHLRVSFKRLAMSAM